MSTRLTGVALALVLLVPVGLARADGDPASDVLLSQDVFLPYGGISRNLERSVYAVDEAARRAGYPLKLALIASPSDLGVVPALFNKPAAYARFLSAELASVVAEPVLVVMPAGLGLAAKGHALSVAAVGAVGSGPAAADALASKAIGAVRRLAAATSHPLATGAAGGSSPANSGARAAVVSHALTAMLVLGLLATAAISAALVARSRQRH